MMGKRQSSGEVRLHLRIRVRPGARAEFFGFLREAIPFYEAPGGVAVRLLQDGADDHRFIEEVAYRDEATYSRDQERVERDTAMRRYLERWRALLAEAPVVEVYRPIEP